MFKTDLTVARDFLTSPSRVSHIPRPNFQRDEGRFLSSLEWRIVAGDFRLFWKSRAISSVLGRLVDSSWPLRSGPSRSSGLRPQPIEPAKSRESVTFCDIVEVYSPMCSTSFGLRLLGSGQNGNRSRVAYRRLAVELHKRVRPARWDRHDR
jgi:hypothetical protein